MIEIYCVCDVCKKKELSPDGNAPLDWGVMQKRISKPVRMKETDAMTTEDKREHYCPDHLDMCR